MNMLDAVGAVLTAAGSGAVAWFFSRKQSAVEIDKLRQEVKTMEALRDSDVKTAEVEIMEKYRELYTNLVDDLGKQLNILKQENSDIRKALSDRQIIMDEMARSMHNMEAEVKKSREDNIILKAEMKQLKNDFPCIDCPRRV
jgi:hypothetical protein